MITANKPWHNELAKPVADQLVSASDRSLILLPGGRNKPQVEQQEPTTSCRQDSAEPLSASKELVTVQENSLPNCDADVFGVVLERELRAMEQVLRTLLEHQGCTMSGMMLGRDSDEVRRYLARLG